MKDLPSSDGILEVRQVGVLQQLPAGLKNCLGAQGNPGDKKQKNSTQVPLCSYLVQGRMELTHSLKIGQIPQRGLFLFVGAPQLLGSYEASAGPTPSLQPTATQDAGERHAHNPFSPCLQPVLALWVAIFSSVRTH